MNYYVITPAKNEEKFISYVLDSMANQTLKPVKWIIVDDGSTDRTKEIVAEYQEKHNWIETLSIDNKNEKKLYGSKVIRAFYTGYDLIKNNDHSFIVKLDADLSFPPDYFQKIGDEFSKNAKLGICGGYIVEKEGDLEKKKARQAYVEGAVKSIKYECFRDIGGFVEENGWDGLDQLKARYLGWEVKNIPLRVQHHRVETTDYLSLQFYHNNGVAHYKQGTSLFLTFVRFLTMLKRKPYVLAGISYLKGYFKSALKKEPKLVDKKLADYINAYHYKRLLNFKR